MIEILKVGSKGKNCPYPRTSHALTPRLGYGDVEKETLTIFMEVEK